MIRILVADDHPAFRRGREPYYGRKQLMIAGEAETGPRAVELTDAPPDVILMDLRMPASTDRRDPEDLPRYRGADRRPDHVRRRRRGVGRNPGRCSRLSPEGADRLEIGRAMRAAAGGGDLRAPIARRLVAHFAGGAGLDRDHLSRSDRTGTRCARGASRPARETRPSPTRLIDQPQNHRRPRLQHLRQVKSPTDQRRS